MKYSLLFTLFIFNTSVVKSQNLIFNFYNGNSNVFEKNINNKSSKLEPLVGARVGSTVSQVNNNIFIYGGLGYDSLGNKTSFNDVWIYDIVQNKFNILEYKNKISSSNEIDFLNQSLVYSNSWIFNNQLFIFGGYYIDKNNKIRYSNNIKILNIESRECEVLALDSDNVPSERANANIWQEGNNVYLYGGLGNDNKKNTIKYLDDFWVFNADTKNWSKLFNRNNEIIGDIRNANTWVFQNKLYIYGGENKYGISNIMACYNFETNAWEKIINSKKTDEVQTYNNSYPSFRKASSTWVHDTLLYLYGGYSFDIYGNECRFGDLWKYNLVTNTWENILPSDGLNLRPNAYYQNKNVYDVSFSPGSRAFAKTFYYKNEFFLYGGLASYNSHGYSSDVWKFKFLEKNEPDVVLSENDQLIGEETAKTSNENIYDETGRNQTSTIAIKNFILFPNPASNFINLKSEKKYDNISLKIYKTSDMKLVLESTILEILESETYPIDISSLLEGNYILNISNSNLNTNIYFIKK